jgi:hypothetical protein
MFETAELDCPGRASARFSVRALTSALRTRCTQNVHFSITPRSLTVTAGFRAIRTVAALPVYLNQLKRRTLYGQLFEQKRVPMQRL